MCLRAINPGPKLSRRPSIPLLLLTATHLLFPQPGIGNPLSQLPPLVVTVDGSSSGSGFFGPGIGQVLSDGTVIVRRRLNETASGGVPLAFSISENPPPAEGRAFWSITAEGLIEFDQLTSEILFLLTSPPSGKRFLSIAFDSDGSLFGFSDIDSSIYQLIPEGSSWFELMQFRIGGDDGRQITGMTFALDGTLYVVDDLLDQLLRVNTATGELTLLTQFATGNVLGLALAPDGTLFTSLSNSRELIQLDTDGNVLWRGPYFSSNPIHGMEFQTASNKRVVEIAGVNSQVAWGCLGLLDVEGEGDCSFDGARLSGLPGVPGGGFDGPVQLSAYYRNGSSPWDANGGPDDGGLSGTSTTGISFAVGDGKSNLSLRGVLIFDDQGEFCTGSGALEGTVTYAAGKTNFWGYGGGAGEEEWEGGDLSFTLGRTVVDSATVNLDGGCDLVIGTAGAPPLITSTSGAVFGDDFDPAIDPWTPNDGGTPPNYLGNSPSLSGNERGVPNVGAPLTVFNGATYSCEYFSAGDPTGVTGPCQYGGLHHELMTGGSRSTIENSVWQISTNSAGDITSATVYPVAQGLDALSFRQWNAPVWIFTGACANCSPPIVDTDEDGFDDTIDNCIDTPNPDQRDSNADGFGNLCDADFDGNGFVNFSDLAFFRSVFASDNADADLNGDGTVNFLDLARFKSRFGRPPGPSGLQP